MNPPSLLARHPALRWLVPLGVAGAAVLVATGMFQASASSDSSLPTTTPAALIAAVQQSQVQGFSGTVVSQMSLGLPDLGSLTNAGGAAPETSLASLLGGSHTVQVWYGGPTKQRVAVLGATDETDIFRDGRDMWEWSSAQQSAEHTLLPAGAAGPPNTVLPSGAASLSPVALAHRALGALDKTTDVTVEGDARVADRSAYQLVLTPRSSATKIGSVHISVDGQTKLPLGVAVYPRGSGQPAVELTFTSIRFAHQSNRNFVFAPPPHATVRQLGPVTRSTSSSTSSPAPRTIGSGWTSVVELAPGQAAVTKLIDSPAAQVLTPVSGSWGRGQLLEASLLSVLITDNGRVFVGAVDPSYLYAAAAHR